MEKNKKYFEDSEADYKVCSTFNLLETNKCWLNLKTNYSLDFEGYGDVISGLLSSSNTGLIFVILLEDLFDGANDDFDSLRQKQEIFFELLKKKAELSTKPIILGIGSGQYQSVIENLKEDTDRKKFHDWLILECASLRDNFESIYLLNFTDIFGNHGNNQMFSERNWYFGRCRLSIKGLQVLADNLLLAIERISKAAKKVLVLDCDNTIWGGVVGEDGIGGLTLGQDGLGQAFVDFQKEALRLSQKGVLIALASKNNEEDVWNVFNNHDSMILKREHIVAAQINWTEKSDNLAILSDNLNLNADSFVFWDDNPLERDKMKNLLPQVLTIDVPDSVLEWPKILRNLDDFAKFKITSEDKKKTSQYKTRAEFNNNLKKVNDINSYLSSLNLQPSLVTLNESNISRAEQMCMKTNQFNLRTKRYSSSDLLEMSEDKNCEVFLVNLTDNYGDHGIVALVCLRYLQQKIVFLDTLLMSCRVLGRHLEAWVLSKVLEDAKENKIQFIIAEYIESKRNQIAKEFLNDYGFKELNKAEHIFTFAKKEIDDLEGSGYYLKVMDAIIPNIAVYEREK